MPKKPLYIPFFLDDIDALEPLGDAERGRLFTALLEYGRLGATEKISGNERFVFPMFRGRIDRFFESYAETCEQNAANVKRRYTNATSVYDRNDRIRKLPSESETESETEKESESESGVTRARSPRFTPPTLAEVQSYVAERHSPVDPQAFIDFYEAKGWMVGKTPMKDWKAACRNAERWDRWAKSDANQGESSFDCDEFFEAAVRKATRG